MIIILLFFLIILNITIHDVVVFLAGFLQPNILIVGVMLPILRSVFHVFHVSRLVDLASLGVLQVLFIGQVCNLSRLE